MPAARPLGQQAESSEPASGLSIFRTVAATEARGALAGQAARPIAGSHDRVFGRSAGARRSSYNLSARRPLLFYDTMSKGATARAHRVGSALNVTPAIILGERSRTVWTAHR